MALPVTTDQQLTCYHCGEPCRNSDIRSNDKIFCCEGCRMVYGILNEYELCNYYDLNKAPGINQRSMARSDKFAYLDDENTESRLISFKDQQETHISLYLPQMHCSSCLYLLENLHRIEPAIVSSKVNFTRKEIDLVFHHNLISLRKVVEVLASIGYEPYISLNDLHEKKAPINKGMIYQLGVAGFCFGNIMLMSFPEYLGIDASETTLRSVFRWINLVLALPVFFYSALPFYQSSWKSLRHKYLNIDAPIALAVIITFVRSVWEVVAGSGGGYFDSMTGIVFFMLAGRIVQDKTYRQLSFDRDYTSYFPVAVSVLRNDKAIPTQLPDIKPGDTLRIHNEELIPADGILTRGKAYIDYSFVTGESLPVLKEMGELIYAGGKQCGEAIELLVIKEVKQSYLTKLWNSDTFKTPAAQNNSFVHLLSRYFTYIVLGIAALTALYWQTHEPARLWPAVTAIFIIACPCALLLSNTFTNGNILQILSRNKFYLRNAQAIEDMGTITHIVFDKTGTLTAPGEQSVSYYGKALTDVNKLEIAAVAACSSHPLSKAIVQFLGKPGSISIDHYEEIAGMGMEAVVENRIIRIGSAAFVSEELKPTSYTSVFVSVNGRVLGHFGFRNQYRRQLQALINTLKKEYQLSVISGDNDGEKNSLRKLFGNDVPVFFNQGPSDKLNYIRSLQQQGYKVMMMGDGLNDAGALKQSDMGIAITEHSNNFTPSSDGILEAGKLPLLYKFIRFCRANKRIVIASFVLSIVYNIIGLYFAVQGNLSPLIAAILMPSSSLSIVLVTFGSSNWLARRMKC